MKISDQQLLTQMQPLTEFLKHPSRYRRWEDGPTSSPKVGSSFLTAWLPCKLVIFWILNALWIRWGGKRHGVHLQVQSQWRTLGSVRSFNKRRLHGPWVFPKNMMMWSCLVRIIWCPFHSFTEMSHVDLYLKSMFFGFSSLHFFEASAENATFHCHLVGMPRWWAIPAFPQQPSPLCEILSQKWMISWKFSWIFAQLFAFTC